MNEVDKYCANCMKRFDKEEDKVKIIKTKKKRGKDGFIKDEDKGHGLGDEEIQKGTIEVRELLLEEGVGQIGIPLEGEAGSLETLNESSLLKEGKEIVVSIVEALSIVFGVDLGSNLEETGWKKDDNCSLCYDCAKTMTSLYSAFEDFSDMTVQESYVAKGWKRCPKRACGEPKETTVKLERLDTSTSHEEVKGSQSKRPGRKAKSVSKNAQSTGVRTRCKREPKTEEEFISGDLDVGSDESSDSESLSDLENDGDEAPPKGTRSSTRPRTAKKPPSDYEELPSSEEEPLDQFEDDEEQDPNFNAEDEVKDIKVTQESLRLHRLWEMCGNVVEYKVENLQVDDEGRYVCPEVGCDKTFKNLNALSRHAVLHKIEKFKCPHCSAEFVSIDDLHRHVKATHSKLMHKRGPGRPPKRKKGRRGKDDDSLDTLGFICTSCGEVFDTLSSLSDHEHAEHGPVTCSTCHKQFPTHALLNRHQNGVHNKTEIDYSCPECGDQFDALEPLSTHFTISHNAELNFCEQCGKSFHRYQYLITHLIETHSIIIEEVASEGQEEVSMEENAEHQEDPFLELGERRRKTDPAPYKCIHCEKDFKRKKQLDIHLLFHNGEEPQHTCHHCSKRFFQLKTLKRHLTQHTANNHPCDQCHRVFPRADALKRHIDSAHSGAEPNDKGKKVKKENKDSTEYRCNECDKTFTRKEYLKLHERIHTGEKPFNCSECGKSFRDPRNLAQHLVTHKTDRPFCCSICGLTFKRAHHLHDHEGTHKEDVARPFVCSLPNCGKAFKLKKHLISHELVHSGTKDHQCEICGKAFNRKDNLRQHVNKVHGKESFSDLIRVPGPDGEVTEVHLVPQQEVTIQVQTPNLVPVTAITTDGDNSTTITTIQIPAQVLQALPGATFTYTPL